MKGLEKYPHNEPAGKALKRGLRKIGGWRGAIWFVTPSVIVALFVYIGAFSSIFAEMRESVDYLTAVNFALREAFAHEFAFIFFVVVAAGIALFLLIVDNVIPARKRLLRMTGSHVGPRGKAIGTLIILSIIVPTAFVLMRAGVNIETALLLFVITGIFLRYVWVGAE